MIRHIVLWKLAAPDEELKAQGFAAISAALTRLVPLIPEIQNLSVTRNIAYPERNFDVALVAEYASLDDLQTYQTHPEHLITAAIVSSLVSDRAAVDFEL